MPIQHFLIEGRSYGSCLRPVRDSRGQAPMSYAFFCPTCAEVWARAGIIDRKFFVFHVPCRKHTYDGIPVPGSLWNCGDKDFLEALPHDVLCRELSVHLDYAESKLL